MPNINAEPDLPNPRLTWIQRTDEGWIAFLKELQTKGYDLFKFDVTFKASGHRRSEQRWLSYFEQRVLHKVQKAIGYRAPINADAREYEFGISSRTRLPDLRNPHHVHSLLLVPSARAFRMYGVRLDLDITSLRLVSDYYVERIPLAGTDDNRTVEAAYWYMRKGKTWRTIQ